ncbi:hypothetical protein ACFLTM_00885 [Candidatus Bipolaricaulota bacterium]
MLTGKTSRRVSILRAVGFLLMGTILISQPLVGASSSISLPNAAGEWVVPEGENVARKPVGEILIDVLDEGHFVVDAAQVETVRPDIFQPGHFSVFDVLVQLAEQGDIELDYHFDESMNTHVIDAINGQSGWWYEARYAGGWYERNVTRMDTYPVKDGMSILIRPDDGDRVARIHESFAGEVVRLEANDGQVVLPEVLIRGRRGRAEFLDVVVTAHDTRADLFQPGVITALDVLLSLGEQGHLSQLGITWYDEILGIGPVDNYWVERMTGGGAQGIADGGCGFVYEVGPTAFPGFAGSHIHLPSDARVLVSPEYMLWFWICLPPEEH